MLEEKNQKKISYTIKVLEHTSEVVPSDAGGRLDTRSNEIFMQQFENVDVGALARFLNAEQEKKEEK